MSERTDYCKRLMRKALIIYDNLGPNEAEEMSIYMDKLDEQHNESALLVDDATPCKCDIRTDVVAFNDKKYCCDCLHYIEEKKSEEEEKNRRSEYKSRHNVVSFAHLRPS